MRLATTNFFEGSALLRVTVQDDKGTSTANDCNIPRNQLNTDPGDDTDCDNDGMRDIVIRASSDAEPGDEGEYFIVNETAPGSGIFVHEIPISAGYDVDGVLFIQPQAVLVPLVTVETFDWDDGSGSPCANDLDPAVRGLVRTATAVIISSGQVTIATTLTDNGDNDGLADTNETVEMQISVTNKTGADLTTVIARLGSNDPNVDCVVNSFVVVGDIAAGATEQGSAPFTFHVANVDRTTMGLTDLDLLTATLDVTVSADQFAANQLPLSVTLDLDLDAAGGGSPSSYFEGFEVASGLSGFTTMNLDFGSTGVPGSPVLGDGARCQYSDPDWVHSNSYGTPSANTCVPGSSPSFADAYYWQVHQESDIDGGRAYSGTRSLYFGIFGDAADEHTTPLSVLEAVRMQNPVALAVSGERPELSFKHMVSLVDWRTVSANTAADRGVVFAQLADLSGTAVGDWIKLYPYYNSYDSVGTDNYTNCLFDPVDDGNTEDDFFDPADPLRRLGPSSTCTPEPVFTYAGDTYNAFDAQSIGLASDGPGLAGSLGIGTWVESRISLERFRGRNVRLRFLLTSLDNGSSTTYQNTFQHNPDPGDDGWWIDDITIDRTLTSPAIMSNDDTDNSALPGCGAVCNSVSATLTSDPGPPLAAPGQVVELSALASVADRCLDGALQFQFWRDGDGDGAGGGVSDTLLRSWTDNPFYVDAPIDTIPYAVTVRCSEDHACTGDAGLTVVVTCPSSSGVGGFPVVTAPNTNTLSWNGATDAEYARGDLATLASYTTTASGPLSAATSFDISSDNPSSGTASWYLFRLPGTVGPGAFCNETVTWNAGGAPARDPALP